MAADPFVSTVIVVTMFLGGVGFMAADDFLRHRSWSGLSLNSKLIFLMEAILIPLGTIIFYNLEGNNPETLGGLSTMEKWQSAVLMSVSSRLGGFAVFDIHSMLDQTVLLVMMFMFIGGSSRIDGRRHTYDNDRTAFLITLCLDKRQKRCCYFS